MWNQIFDHVNHRSPLKASLRFFFAAIQSESTLFAPWLELACTCPKRYADIDEVAFV
jgi:hypothetical protein